MKTNLNLKFRQLLLAALLWTAPLLNAVTVQAQGTVTGDLPHKTYLPFVSGDGTTTTATTTTGSADLVPGQYVVVFHETTVQAASVAATATDLASNLGGELLHTYDAALSGFALKLPLANVDNALALLQSDSRVSYVVQDQVVHLDPLEQPQVISDTTTLVADESDMAVATALAATPMTADESVAAAGIEQLDTTQNNPPWGLDRIDQRNLPLNLTYNYANSGLNSRVFIIDTGIRITHHEFKGRALYGYDAVDGSLPADDCDGHGTHVAGTVGGSTYGVAKGVQLVAVRVLDCEGFGTWSDIIDGINWVTNQKRANPNVPMVANMSLGGGQFTPVDTAVQNSIAAGVTYVVAAGNGYDWNACELSPANVPQAITVGATAATDNKADFSNIGNCLDLFAPGVGVRSAYGSSDTATALLNGTSMASPHVAGVAALYLHANPTASPAQVAAWVSTNATANVVANPGNGSPNRLLYTLAATPVTCFADYPHLPLVLGTDGDDPNLIGTNVSERICGLLGNDTIFGQGGNDVMGGNDGIDTLYGGTGNDLIGGGKENDLVNGDDGNDNVGGGLGDDTVYGGKGNDDVHGGEENDFVGGGQGNDKIYGETGNDILNGGAENDSLWGGDGADTFYYYAGQGNDIINDFQGNVDQLTLFDISSFSLERKGKDCIVKLATGATIRLVKYSACQDPTVR